MYDFLTSLKLCFNLTGEEFGDTARREVFEETGIETEFVSVVSLRHKHEHIFNCSDIYVVCHLRPLTHSIEPSNDEIAQCEWMDVCITYLNFYFINYVFKFLLE